MRSNSLQSVDFPLHLLNLEILLIKKFLLPLLLSLELSNIGFEISWSWKSTRDISNEVSLLFTQLKEHLRLFEKDFFLWSDFFVNFSHHILRFLVLSLSWLICTFKSILGSFLTGKSILSCLVLLLSSIKSLHLLFKNLVVIGDISSLVSQLCSKGRKLIP